jgi:hypothetical protein
MLTPLLRVTYPASATNKSKIYDAASDDVVRGGASASVIDSGTAAAKL